MNDAALAALDAAGFIPGCGEGEPEYLARIERCRQAWQELESGLEENGRAGAFGITVCPADRIGREIIDEAGEVTGELYGFRMTTIPGFYLSRGVGWLWGGCLIGDPDTDLSLLFLRGSFRHRTKWLFYQRRELVAHELCHAARQVIDDPTLEEHFAYQTSPSLLRRSIGNCFIRDIDALLFFVPTLILLTVQLCRIFLQLPLPVWPFWLLALAAPCWLMWRNAVSRRIVRRAERVLRRMGVAMPEAVMFRCCRGELLQLAAVKDAAEFAGFVAERAAAEVRWRIIRCRFIDNLPLTGDPVQPEKTPAADNFSEAAGAVCING